MVKPEDVPSMLRACRDSGDDSTLPKIILELDVTLAGHKELPNGLFEGLVGLLQDEKFLRLEESWNLVYLLNNQWDALSADQREKLRPTLAFAFDKYGNWMGAFVTAEIFGDRFADERSLAALVDFSRTARLPARALVPHGLEYLVKTTEDNRLGVLALDRLRELSGAENEQVRQEATNSLRKLGSAI